MGKKSNVWLHFSPPAKVDGRQITQCKWCKENFSYAGSTTNLHNHLKRKHPFLETGTYEQEDERKGSVSAGDVKPPKQMKLRFGAMTNARKEKITQLITEFVVKDMRPISVVKGQYFTKLLNYLEPAYEMPSNDTICRRVETMYKQKKEELKKEILQAPHVSLTCDAWTSIKMEAFFCVTAHFVNETFNLQSRVLGVRPLQERHTAINISGWVEEIVEEFQMSPPTIVAIVSDNAANMKSAKDTLKEKYGWENFSCTAHTLQLCLNNGMKTAAIDKVRGSARRLVQHFKRSEVATSALAKKCQEMQVTPKKLVIDVSTRWNSTYLMFQRLIELQWPIMAVLSDPMLTDHSHAQTLAPKPSDWDLMRLLCPVLKPFAEATDVLGGEKYVSISLRNPYIKGLKKHLSVCGPKSDSTVVKEFCKTVGEQIHTRFSSELFDISSKATALDPRYKLRGLRSADAAELKASLLEDLDPMTEKEQTAVEPPTSELIKAVDMALDSSESDESIVERSGDHDRSDELKRYFAMKNLNACGDPLAWWREHENMFPSMAKLCRKLLCVPATSTPSERVFSTAGNTSSSLRSSLTGEHVEALVFLKCNE